MYNYKNLCPFKWYVLENFPFIEADFDAITNWQLFCKLGGEINKIIEKLNLTGKQVEDLTNAFNDLENYVNNYFSELNVQSEINNKLDEMADDGTLDDIINRQIFAELNEQIQANSTNINNLSLRVTENENNIEQNKNNISKNSKQIVKNFLFPNCISVAHRGLSCEAPENTLASIIKARLSSRRRSRNGY